MHFLSFRHLKEKRPKTRSASTTNTLGILGVSLEIQITLQFTRSLSVAPQCSVWASVEVRGQGDVERAQPPAPAGTRPCGHTDGLILMLDPAVETQEKAQVTTDSHQKTTHKALKHMDQQPVYNGLTFSVTAAQAQQLSRQLGSCYGPRKHWAGICNPLAWLLAKRHLEEGACLPLCVVRIKHQAPSTCHSAAERGAFAGTAAVA